MDEGERLLAKTQELLNVLSIGGAVEDAFKNAACGILTRGAADGFRGGLRALESIDAACEQVANKDHVLLALVLALGHAIMEVNPAGEMRLSYAATVTTLATYTGCDKTAAYLASSRRFRSAGKAAAQRRLLENSEPYGNG